MKIVPINLKDSNSYVRRFHRHHKPVVGHKFSVALHDDDGDLCGVAIVGRPVARAYDDGLTLEVNRCCTDGTQNACSMLYRAAWRVAKELGYQQLITYTLPEEGGASLRAAGFECLGERGGGSWSRPSRPRLDSHPTQIKWLWRITRGPVCRTSVATPVSDCSKEAVKYLGPWCLRVAGAAGLESYQRFSLEPLEPCVLIGLHPCSH